MKIFITCNTVFRVHAWSTVKAKFFANNFIYEYFGSKNIQ
jgi:hypothetical protein